MLKKSNALITFKSLVIVGQSHKLTYNSNTWKHKKTLPLKGLKYTVLDKAIWRENDAANQ